MKKLIIILTSFFLITSLSACNSSDKNPYSDLFKDEVIGYEDRWNDSFWDKVYSTSMKSFINGDQGFTAVREIKFTVLDTAEINKISFDIECNQSIIFGWQLSVDNSITNMPFDNYEDGYQLNKGEKLLLKSMNYG